MASLTGVCIYANLFLFCFSMKVVPERVEVDYVNDEYATEVIANVRRYSRKGGYYVNLGANIKHSWGNNISFDVIFYEWLHNEYKQTFVEFHFDQGCRLIDTDPYLGKALGEALEKMGLTCPAGPGKVFLSNLSLPMEKFPYIWPFERAKAVGTVRCNHRQTLIGNGSLYLRFEQKKKNH